MDRAKLQQLACVMDDVASVTETHLSRRYSSVSSCRLATSVSIAPAIRSAAKYRSTQPTSTRCLPSACLFHRSGLQLVSLSFCYWAHSMGGGIAVPSVTRCRCCRCCYGHRCAGGVRQWRHLVNGNVKLAACVGSQWRMGPTFFKCFLLIEVVLRCRGKKVKFTHTCYRALGPELIPVYRQTTLR